MVMTKNLKILIIIKIEKKMKIYKKLKLIVNHTILYLRKNIIFINYILLIVKKTF